LEERPVQRAPLLGDGGMPLAGTQPSLSNPDGAQHLLRNMLRGVEHFDGEAPELLGLLE